MGARNELQKDHGVDWYVATSCGTNDCPEDAECGEVAETCHRHSKNTSDDERSVESWLSSNKVGSCAPKEGTEDETGIVGDRAQGDVGDT